MNGVKLYQDYKDIIISYKRAKQKGGKTGLSSKGTSQIHLINGIATVLQILLTFPVSVVSCEHS
jgi:hypothetical protein